MTWMLVLLFSNGMAIAPMQYWTKEECVSVGKQFKDSGFYTRDYQCLPGPTPKKML